MTSRSTPEPGRGEVWWIRFDPVQGSEIGKTRPAVVANPRSIGRLPLRIVVPVTGWKSAYEAVPWLVRLEPSPRNGLKKASVADCFQVKSVSVRRFVDRIGDVHARDIREISAAIAVCVDA